MTDPIVLFNPTKSPTTEEILIGKLDLVYPQIDICRKKIDSIKQDFYKVADTYHKTKFNDLYIKVEFGERLKDFFKIIRIIEIFYDENEYEKFNLINEYFGIDFELLEEIFSNTELITDFFSDTSHQLDEKIIRSLERKKVNKEQLVFYFEEALRFHGLENNWKVLIGDVVSVVHTNFRMGGGEIIIPETYKPRSIKATLSLIAHEIDGHCVQFTNCDCLSGGTIRYSESESLAEGFAMYNQYLFENNIFGAKKTIAKFIVKNQNRFDSISDPKKLKKYLDVLGGSGLRFFRGFSNINTYKNLKDFVYIQGLYKIIKYTEKYENAIPLVKRGAINFSYINKYGIKIKKGRAKIKITELSAHYILYNYFIK